LERSSSGPLGIDLAVNFYAMERSSSSPLGKDLLACSKKRVVVVDAEVAGDIAVQEMGVFRKLLDLFEEWLLWASAHKSHLGWVSSIGLKRRLGRTNYSFSWE
jgi:hypothetical protein